MDPTLARFVRSIKEHLTAEDVIAFESCMNCRSCGSACAWYLATEDERLHPKYKKDLISKTYKGYATLGGRVLAGLGLFRPPTLSELRAAMDFFWKCTACGRCTLACPLSLNNRGIVRLARAAYQDAGLSQEHPVHRAIMSNARNLRHTYGLRREQVNLRLAFFAAYQRTEVPVDAAGAEYLFICPSVGNTHFPELALKVPQLLNAAGVDYTLSSRIVDTGTEVDHIVVDHKLARQMLVEIEDEAKRLGTPTLVVAECGCDIRTFLVDSTRLLGRKFKLKVCTLDALLLELIETGRLPVAAVANRITLHDPCYVTRLSGMGEPIRRLLRRVSADFVEMSPSREFNYCCNGGSGPLRLPENEDLRRRVSRFKVNQILASHAAWVVTPCAVCMLTLADICQHYNLSPPDERMVFMLFEIVHQAVQGALPGSERFEQPAVLAGKDQAYLAGHSIAGWAQAIGRGRDFPSLARWLAADPSVRRFCAEHPSGQAFLEAWLHRLSGSPAAGLTAGEQSA